MANNVFANSREVSCKAADGKSICAFPDVCMTPPENPATPPGVPVPYPNTGFARDTTEGSRSVLISGKEVILKNKSYFKTSTGDEAGCAAKKGVITSTHRGKVYFIAWSSDVKVEGENACRHVDMTTHNHASPMANEAAPMLYADEMFLAAMEAWSESALRCACCGSLAHSEAQARGDTVSEAEFYAGHPDGADWLQLARESCPHLVPPPPPTNDPCATYYRGIGSTKGPRAEYSQAGANPLSNPNSLPHVYGRGRMAHRVPLAGGGCPIGEGNLQPVGEDPNCQYLEKISSDIHGACMKALQ